jgi:hypothetical protein
MVGSTGHQFQWAGNVDTLQCDRCLRVNGVYNDQLQTVTVEFAVDIGSGFLRGKEAVVCF